MNSDKSIIQAGYELYSTAFINKDIDAVMAIFTEDFKWMFLDGTSMDWSDTRTAIIQQMDATIVVENMTVVVEGFEVFGDEAIAYTKEHLEATMRGEDGSLEYMTVDETYRDVWVKVSGIWKFQTAEVLTSETKVEPCPTTASPE